MKPLASTTKDMPELTNYLAERKGYKTDCWVFSGANDGRYGVVRYANKVWRAHRYNYVRSFGELSSSLVVRHKCNVSLCIRPDHLVSGTKKQNSLDAKLNKSWSRSHCKRNHYLDEQNIYFNSNGHKQCKQCHKLRKQLSVAELKEFDAKLLADQTDRANEEKYFVSLNKQFEILSLA
jgi:hypothetical protein